ncbi:MAG: SIMPL domain-containing protein [Candidatus Woesearchaeota archaeon]
MKIEKESNQTIWLVFGIAFLFLGLFLGNMMQNKENNVSKINIYQQVEKKVMPDEAIVVFSIITEAKDAKTAVDENTKINNKLMDVFKNYKVETEQFYVNKKQRWNKEKEQFEDDGYTVTNTFKVTTKPDDLGNVINLGISNGANSVNYIDFRVSDKRKEELNQELLSEAIIKAKEKAKTIAEKANLKIVRILEITPSEINYPFYRSAAMGKDLSSENINLQPTEETLRYSVNVVFEIK